MSHPYVTPNSLRKPFKIPYKPKASVITPLSKAISNSVTRATSKLPVAPSGTSRKTSQTKFKQTFQIEPNVVNGAEDILESDIFSVFHKENSSHATEDNIHVPKILNQCEANSVYNSPYLDKGFKPSKETFELAPELETLELLILSQHEVLTEPIKELRTINLTLTKMIEKKNDSFQLLQNKNKFPRSLRIKFELTTSPSSVTNPSFIKLKEEL
jgi:hypothetical protein